nr:PREDICTED: uncharacterized protein LOC100882035 [Megachile rotundata]
MSGKIEYLEKYSIAPSPSRDYYGLRVLGDQVILYLWRISHGPHKLPVVRTASFDDFTQDKLLQDEIRRIFGKYLLIHIRYIASGQRNSLLTLPKCLIEKLIRYLTVQDIVQLSSLSHVAKEVFDDNSVWKALYKKYKPLKRPYGKLEAISWKELFQMAQMQGLIKMSRPRPITKQTKSPPKPEDFPRASNFGRFPKPAAAENQPPKKPPKNVPKKIVQNPVPRKLSESRLDGATIEKEKLQSSEKKNSLIRSLQTAAQKNMKSMKQQSSTKLEAKIETKDSLKDKPSETKLKQNRTRKIDPKYSNSSLKTSEENSKSKIVNPKGKNEKPVMKSVQEDPVKLKPKNKTKKIGQSKSTILKTASAVLDDQGLRSVVKNDCLDLADLIEASLKNMHSPGSIFEGSFEKSRLSGGDAKLFELNDKMDHPRGLLKSSKATLDRLSEKSEPLTGKSVDSVNKSDLSGRSVAKRKTANVGKKVPNKNEYDDAMEFDEYFERYYHKNIEPQRENEDKRGTRKAMDKMSVLRSLGAKNSFRKMAGGAIPELNRYELKKAMGSFYK